MAEPQLQGRIALIVNGGIPPLSLQFYFCDAEAIGRAIPLISAAPFQAVIVGDEMGAYRWTEPQDISDAVAPR